MIPVNFPYVSNNDEVINVLSVEEDIPKQYHLPSHRQHPEEVPFEPIEENVGLLEKWFLDIFPVVFDTEAFPLRVMNGKEMSIHLTEDAAVNVYTVRSPLPVPVHWKEEVQRQLEINEQLGIIEKVPIGEPVEWCTRMVVVKKKDGSPRITADYQELNKYIRRESYPIAYPFDLVSTIPLHSYKTVADAYQGYHQVKLDESSLKLTTFIHESGRYRYLRNPQGLRSAGDAYSHRYGDLLADIPRKCRVIDDTCMYASSIKDAFYHIYI